MIILINLVIKEQDVFAETTLKVKSYYKFLKIPNWGRSLEKFLPDFQDFFQFYQTRGEQ
jgi:hypothetical protein